MGTKTKLPPMKKTTTKAKKTKQTPEDDMPLPQAVSKPHTRKAKPAETQRIDRAAKNREMAIKWIMRRDDMDEETATIVVDSMDPADVVQLNSEAADAVIEKSKALMAPATPAPSAPVASPAATPVNSAVPDAEDAATPAVDFLEVEGLVSNEEFAELAVSTRDDAVTKNEAEKRYKANKKKLDAILADAGIDKLAPVMCLGVRLVRYTGKSPRFLSDTKLLEKGVSIDVINQCWVQGEYDDVRITTPKVEG